MCVYTHAHLGTVEIIYSEYRRRLLQQIQIDLLKRSDRAGNSQHLAHVILGSIEQATLAQLYFLILYITSMTFSITNKPVPQLTKAEIGQQIGKVTRYFIASQKKERAEAFQKVCTNRLYPAAILVQRKKTTCFKALSIFSSDQNEILIIPIA